MTTYARIVDGHVVEIIEPYIAEANILRPSDEPDGEPVVAVETGQEVPIELRFHPEFVAELVVYDPANPPRPPAPKAPTEAEVRVRRDGALALSDWTQLSDVASEVREKWAPYRQALRDITKQPGFPEQVKWPTPPEAAA